MIFCFEKFKVQGSKLGKVFIGNIGFPAYANEYDGRGRLPYQLFMRSRRQEPLNILVILNGTQWSEESRRLKREILHSAQNDK